MTAAPCLTPQQAQEAGAALFERTAAGRLSQRKREQIAALLAAARKPDTKDVA